MIVGLSPEPPKELYSGESFAPAIRSGQGNSSAASGDASPTLNLPRHGAWFVISSERGAVRAWNLESPDQYYDLEAHKQPVTDVAAFELPSPTNGAKSQWMATGGLDGAVFFWNLDKPMTKPACRLDLGRQYVRDLAVTLPETTPESSPTLLIGTYEGQVIACSLGCLAKQTAETEPAKAEGSSLFPEDQRLVFKHPWDRFLNMNSMSFVDHITFAVAASDGQLYTGRLDQAKDAPPGRKKTSPPKTD